MKSAYTTTPRGERSSPKVPGTLEACLPTERLRAQEVDKAEINRHPETPREMRSSERKRQAIGFSALAALLRAAAREETIPRDCKGRRRGLP